MKILSRDDEDSMARGQRSASEGCNGMGRQPGVLPDRIASMTTRLVAMRPRGLSSLSAG
jgi:hypothetical protein